MAQIDPSAARSMPELTGLKESMAMTGRSIGTPYKQFHDSRTVRCHRGRLRYRRDGDGCSPGQSSRTKGARPRETLHGRRPHPCVPSPQLRVGRWGALCRSGAHTRLAGARAVRVPRRGPTVLECDARRVRPSEHRRTPFRLRQRPRTVARRARSDIPWRAIRDRSVLQGYPAMHAAPSVCSSSRKLYPHSSAESSARDCARRF